MGVCLSARTPTNTQARGVSAHLLHSRVKGAYWFTLAKQHRYPSARRAGGDRVCNHCTVLICRKQLRVGGAPGKTGDPGRLVGRGRRCCTNGHSERAVVLLAIHPLHGSRACRLPLTLWLVAVYSTRLVDPSSTWTDTVPLAVAAATMVSSGLNRTA